MTSTDVGGVDVDHATEDSATVDSATVEVRAFAAARAALGVPTLTVVVPAGPGAGATVADVVAAVLRASPGAADVVARCSVLVGGLRSDASAPVHDGAVVDLLPPFAGG